MAEGDAPVTRVRVVVVGDGAVGKTCLLHVYVKREFPEKYVPTIFDNWSAEVSAGERRVKLELWDTAGQEEYERLRHLSYKETNVFLLCFSVVEPASHHNIRAKWVHEVRLHQPKAQLIVVGTKADLRDDADTVRALRAQHASPITRQQGEQLAEQIGAAAYVECSAKRDFNVKAVFDMAIRITLCPPAPTGSARGGASSSAPSVMKRCTLL